MTREEYGMQLRGELKVLLETFIDHIENTDVPLEFLLPDLLDQIRVYRRRYETWPDTPARQGEVS